VPPRRGLDRPITPGGAPSEVRLLRLLVMAMHLDKYGVIQLGGIRIVFRDVRDKSGLPPTPERLRQRSEPTLRAGS
jgi:hypothetical protein